MDNKLIDNNYNIDSLFDNIKDMVINSRNRVYSAVNTEKKVSPFFVASINETVEITKFGQYALLGFCFYCFTAI